jgi:hypothetical protein
MPTGLKPEATMHPRRLPEAPLPHRALSPFQLRRCFSPGTPQESFVAELRR